MFEKKVRNAFVTVHHAESKRAMGLPVQQRRDAAHWRAPARRRAAVVVMDFTSTTATAPADIF